MAGTFPPPQPRVLPQGLPPGEPRLRARALGPSAAVPEGRRHCSGESMPDGAALLPSLLAPPARPDFATAQHAGLFSPSPTNPSPAASAQSPLPRGWGVDTAWPRWPEEARERLGLCGHQRPGPHPQRGQMWLCGASRPVASAVGGASEHGAEGSVQEGPRPPPTPRQGLRSLESGPDLKGRHGPWEAVKDWVTGGRRARDAGWGGRGLCTSPT